VVTWFPGSLTPRNPFSRSISLVQSSQIPSRCFPIYVGVLQADVLWMGRFLTFRQSPIDLCPSPGLVKKSVVQVEVVEMSFSLFPYTLICGLLFKRETQGFPTLFSNTLFLKHSWLTYVGLYHRHPKICTFCTQPCFFLEWAPNLHFTTYGHPE
jgi:hypothetical protein